MAASGLTVASRYAGSCIILPTQHAKSNAIAPPFWQTLAASVLEYEINTDILGTFSGEVERPGTALECARSKCAWALDLLGEKVEFVVASEGSFGPQPLIPFLPCDHEILYFIDRRHGFHLHLTHSSAKTNYRMGVVESLDSLAQFAEITQFPSHALILRPGHREIKMPIFKGLDSQAALEEAFRECLKYATDGKVWVETDMRAHVNPSRMAVIAELATQFAKRLASECPACGTPGWGKAKVENGLACRDCGLETELIKAEIFACTQCPYEEVKGRTDGLSAAEPGDCAYCNP